MKKNLFGKKKSVIEKVVEVVKKPQRPELTIVSDEKKLDIPENLTGDERKRAMITKANEEVIAICKKYECIMGVWINRKSLAELTDMFTKNPGIELYRLEPQLRID